MRAWPGAWPSSVMLDPSRLRLYWRPNPRVVPAISRGPLWGPLSVTSWIVR